ADWEAIDRKVPAPTFFARPAWASAIVHAYPRFELAPTWCELNDGSRVFVPMVRSRGRLGLSEYFAMPLDKYTAAMESDGRLADPARAEAVFSYILTHMGQSCTLTPWPPAFGSITIPGITHDARETSLIDLSDGADAALSRMSGNARRMANQADRRGVTCACEAASSEIVDEYYAMLRT